MFNIVIGDRCALAALRTRSLTYEQVASHFSDLEATFKQLDDSMHVRSVKRGFEIEFIRVGHLWKINTVFLYYRTHKIASFEGVAPYDINGKWTLQTAVFYLGEPTQKSKKNVEVVYGHLGLVLVFEGKWGADTNNIEYAYLTPVREVGKCSSCLKENSEESECRCKLVKYCSEECRAKHLGLHLIFCIDID